MTISIYKQQKNMELKRRALKLYKQGLTLREVAALIGRSHEWVNKSIKELTAIDTGSSKE